MEMCKQLCHFTRLTDFGLLKLCRPSYLSYLPPSVVTIGLSSAALCSLTLQEYETVKANRQPRYATWRESQMKQYKEQCIEEMK
jgi:hypothetical protein